MEDGNQFPDDQNKVERDKLRALLLEDSGSAAEADSLLETISRLRHWEAPRPSTSSTSLLIQTLISELPQPTKSSLLVQVLGERWSVLLVRAQFRVVRREIWMASLLVMVLGTIVTLLSYTPTPDGLTPIAVFAPLVAALGVAFLYGDDVEQMLEIENSTPASTRLLLLTRLMLIFVFDLGLGLAGSICLSIVHAEVLLWPLVLSWLAPMAFLSSVSFLLSMLLSDALIGAVFGMVLWVLHLWMQSAPRTDLIGQILSLPGLSSPEFRPLLIAVAIPLVGIGLWIVGREDRIVSGVN